MSKWVIDTSKATELISWELQPQSLFSGNILIKWAGQEKSRLFSPLNNKIKNKFIFITKHCKQPSLGFLFWVPIKDFQTEEHCWAPSSIFSLPALPLPISTGWRPHASSQGSLWWFSGVKPGKQGERGEIWARFRLETRHRKGRRQRSKEHAHICSQRLLKKAHIPESAKKSGKTAQPEVLLPAQHVLWSHRLMQILSPVGRWNPQGLLKAAAMKTTCRLSSNSTGDCQRGQLWAPGLWEHSSAKTISSALIQPWAELMAEAAASRERGWLWAPHSKSHLAVQDLCQASASKDKSSIPSTCLIP